MTNYICCYYKDLNLTTKFTIDCIQVIVYIRYYFITTRVNPNMDTINVYCDKRISIYCSQYFHPWHFYTHPIELPQVQDSLFKTLNRNNDGRCIQGFTPSRNSVDYKFRDLSVCTHIFITKLIDNAAVNKLLLLYGCALLFCNVIVELRLFMYIMNFICL